MTNDTLREVMNHLHRLESRINKVETMVTNGSIGNSHYKTDPASQEDFDTPNHSTFGREIKADSQLYEEDTSQDYLKSHSESLPQPMAEDEPEAEPGPPVPPGEPAIPINHTTLAGLLLNWPCIRDMVKPHLETGGIRHVQEYPISHEQHRGILIVHGRGEDSHPSRYPREFYPDHGQIEMPDDSSDTASPSPAADWGHVGGLSPADNNIEYKGGVLASDGYPDFSEHKVWSYVRSFKSNILNMHPIIQPKVLDEWVNHFLRTLPVRWNRSKSHKGTGAFAVNNSMPSTTATEAAGSKRKRSPAPEAGFETPSTPSIARPGRLERSIHNALVLTILALGKICLSRSEVPDAVHHVEPLPHGSPSTRNGLPPSPIQASPPSLSSHSQSSGLASPKEPERGRQSRRSSIHGSTAGTSRAGLGLKKNYENIPGLEYFAFATDILGNHAGAYKNMKNVYTLIFAGLYHGQLARPMESFAFIHQASHKLMVILRPYVAALPVPSHLSQPLSLHSLTSSQESRQAAPTQG